jgi:predicted DNA-binding transcriptional regulator AlpA
MKLLNIDEVSGVTRVPVATLRFWRHLADNSGPKSFKIGRRVMYREADVLAWLESQYAAGDAA